jgi:hypothetical protein
MLKAALSVLHSGLLKNALSLNTLKTERYIHLYLSKYP